MRKYIVLLLITGTVWAQTGLDKLVLKEGTEYLGEYSKIEGKIVYFKQKGGLAFQSISMKKVSILELKDGRVLIDNGFLTKQTTLNFEQYEKLTNEEKEVFIEIQAVYDAKKKALKWGFYPILSVTTFGVSMVGALEITNGEIWESPLKMMGLGAISLGAPFYLLKQFKNNTESVNSEEIELYEEIYSREYRKRVLINFTTGSAVPAGFFLLFLSLTFDLGPNAFGPSSNAGFP